MHVVSSITLLLLFFFTTLSAEPVPYVDENDFVHRRHSMIQTHTGYNQTEIHAVLPRLRKYRLKIQRISNNELVGDPVFIEPALEAKDPQGVLHNKINVFHIDNLQHSTEYHLELWEKGTQEEAFAGDRRRFKTLAPNKTEIRYTAASCMCDEVRYNDTKLPIWTQKRLTDPDFMLLLGDITYVDSRDVVTKPISPLDIWQRYLDNFTDSPGTKMYRLKPIISTWDDHDSSNNANSHSPNLRESLALFNMLYGGRSIPGVIENGSDGTYKWFTYGGVDFAILDARTFRENIDTPELAHRYGHLGQTQEEWFFSRALQTRNLLVIAKGDMFGSEAVIEELKDSRDIEAKRINESFFADHPLNYKMFISRLQLLPNPFVFLSGDIHRAAFIRHGPEQTSSRYNPFKTAEWITSPLYSYVYHADDENHPGWPDKDRYAVKNVYNFGLFSVSKKSGGYSIKVEIKGSGTKDKDGVKADWTKPAQPLLEDSLELKRAYQNNKCQHFYRYL